MTTTDDARKRNAREIQIAQHGYDAQAIRVLLVNASGAALKLVRSRENLAGSAGSGSSGDADRVYSLTTGNAVDIIETFLDGVLLVEAASYVIDNSAKTVTMSGQAVFDSSTISIFYNQ